MFAAGDVETVIRVRPPGKDRFGDPSGQSTPDLPIHGCMFAPGSSTEVQQSTNQVSTTGVVYAPVGSDVVPTDQLRIRGALYEVDGKPQQWPPVGVVINVRLYTG